MKRVHLIQHRGKEILYLDFSNCNVNEVFEVIDTAKKVIRVQQQNSVLTLSNVTGTHYNRDAVQALKDFAHGNKPFVKAGAVIGIDGLKKILYDAVMKFTGRNLPAFDDFEKAKDWLVEQ
jgi:hypothetical protein